MMSAASAFALQAVLVILVRTPRGSVRAPLSFCGGGIVACVFMLAPAPAHRSQGKT